MTFAYYNTSEVQKKGKHDKREISKRSDYPMGRNATASEMVSIKSDPLGFMDLLKGSDVIEVLQTVLDWN